jgi:hypothetical protein
MAVVLPFAGSLLGVTFFFLINLPFWSDDVIMTSPAFLTDNVLTPFELLVKLVGVALTRLGGVQLVFLTVSPNLMTFLVLSNPTPYLELESLSL